MEKYIFDTLESKERIELKLKSPIGKFFKFFKKVLLKYLIFFFKKVLLKYFLIFFFKKVKKN
jgi:hypothetical protein